MPAEPSMDPVIQPISDFRVHWEAEVSPAERLDRLRQAARAFRERMLQGAQVRFYRSFELVRAPYPTRYGFRDALALPVPWMHIVNRVFIVQFDTSEGVKTLVVSPTDPEGNAETPFFARLSARFGPFEELGQKLAAPRKTSVAAALADCGIDAADVDYITYDHLHTQDLRRWLGTCEAPGFFPNAKLLVMRAEWETACAPSPPQRDWYCPGGTEGIDPERIILLDSSVMLGESVALVHTPGHTEGNHSIVCHTPEGLMVTSENGTGPDAYAPAASRIPGLAAYARRTGMEVVLNGNTLERGLEQYMSMVVEKEIAGPSLRDPRFPNMVCSSEFDHWWAMPLLRPTFRFGDLSFGAPLRSAGRPEEAGS